jgi:hypothetical protein
MKKYTKSESIEVVDNRGTDVIKSHLSKTGKVSVADLTEEEMNELRTELTDQNK